MPRSRRIDSARNPLVKELAALKSRRQRERSGLTLIEGVRETERAAEAGLAFQRLLLAPRLWPDGASARADELSRLAAERGAELIQLSPAAFHRISVREHPDGVAAVAPSRLHQLSGFRLPDEPLVLVLDALEKPGNVGALLRTADAAGVDGVLLTGRGTDLGNPNVIRASMGSVFALPIATASAAAARRWLRSAGLRIVASSPHAHHLHWDASYQGATAVVVGSERAGLPPTWLAAADELVRIPMRARVADSLNVGVAGAVILFEAVRQRRSG